tara:strand:+ start:758 stop:1270 length:513 start_codon:yes stop_codon:yes gene_type:complete
MKKNVLITGGNRSGKSEFAESMALKISNKPFYIFTGLNLDLEMNERIIKHKKRRKDKWNEFESYLNLVDVINQTDNQNGTPRLVDCLTIWINNLIFEKLNVEQEINKLIKCIKVQKSPLIMVTNELGLGVIPDNKLSRDFLDVNGDLNKMIANIADEVYLVISGIPLKIK